MMTTNRRWRFVAAVTAVIVLLAVAVPAQAQFGQRRPRPRPEMAPPGAAPTGSMKLRVEDGRVSAEIRSTPMQRALGELAAWTGTVFEVPAHENPNVSVFLYAVPVEQAIRRIAGDLNTIFYYGKDAAGLNRVQLVRVFTRAAPPGAPSISYIGTGSITKTSADIVDSPEQAVAVLSGSPNLEARQKAVEMLVEVKTDEAVEALIGAADDEAPEVRAAVVEGLAEMAAVKAMPAILKALKDAHPGVRQSAITAVALIGTADHVKNLRPLMKDEDAGVAAAADVAIRKLLGQVP